MEMGGGQFVCVCMSSGERHRGERSSVPAHRQVSHSWLMRRGPGDGEDEEGEEKEEEEEE